MLKQVKKNQTISQCSLQSQDSKIKSTIRIKKLHISMLSAPREQHLNVHQDWFANLSKIKFSLMRRQKKHKKNHMLTERIQDLELEDLLVSLPYSYKLCDISELQGPHFQSEDNNPYPMHPIS